MPTERTMTPRVYLAIAITVLAWASAFVVIRGTGEHFSGGALALGRLLVGTGLLSLLLIGKPWVRPTRNEWLLILGYGVIWFGVYNVALNIAEQFLDAGTASMITNTGPILIALGAGLVLREGISKWLGIGAGVAFIGVILIGIGTGTGSTEVSIVGVIWCLGAAFAYAAGVLFQKPALKRLPSHQVTFLGCAIGFVACLPFSGQLVVEVQDAPWQAILGMIYLGAVPTALGFTTWAYALQRMPASQLGVTTYLVPPITIAIAWPTLGERPPALALAGGVLALVGVSLSRRH
jgi:drug/metabolite transporter (DMT)-like permease